jgi:hypothetical protein
MDSYGVVRQNIAIMNKLEGFNVVIICCSSSTLAEYWQARLEQGKGSILSPSSLVLCVEEDWPGGAGNGRCAIFGLFFSTTYLSNIPDFVNYGNLQLWERSTLLERPQPVQRKFIKSIYSRNWSLVGLVWGCITRQGRVLVSLLFRQRRTTTSRE